MDGQGVFLNPSVVTPTLETFKLSQHVSCWPGEIVTHDMLPFPMLVEGRVIIQNRVYLSLIAVGDTRLMPTVRCLMPEDIATPTDPVYH